MAAAAPPANIVADRYLVSPTALAGNPSGPVDALDTHSGRASQVRLVFLTAGWDEDDLTQAVARWRGIACGEVCGVLDFGRHRGHWYLALPPSLGVPVVRWRAMRLPGPADAARLVLGFGRLVERVAAAGFAPELAGVDDFAVGPGPTPFLERPLLPLPGAVPEAPPGGGQRVLSRLLDALVARRDIPDELREWAERSSTGGFRSLGECLDELERAGTAAAAATGADPPGLSGIFDDDELDAMERAAARVPGRWRRIAGAVAGAVILATAGLALVDPGAPAERAKPRATVPLTTISPPAAPAAHSREPAPAATHHRRRHVRHRRPTAPAPDAGSGADAGVDVPDAARLSGTGRARRALGRPTGPSGAGRHDAPQPVSRLAATIAACEPPPMTSFASTRLPAALPGTPTRRIRHSRWVRPCFRPAAGSPSSASTSRTPRTA